MAKVIRISERLSNREKVSRAIRVYEKRKEKLSRLIDRLRTPKRGKEPNGEQ
jgi:hypothetical protein